MEFVLRRRAAGMTAPAAGFMSGLRPRRRGLKQNKINTVNTSSLLHRLTKEQGWAIERGPDLREFRRLRSFVQR